MAVLCGNHGTERVHHQDATTARLCYEGWLCTWLVLVPSGHPEPDSYADTVRETECGLPMEPYGRDGRRCEAGHEFGNLEDRYAPFGEAWQEELQAQQEGRW